jgi:hypothetical protein
MYYEINLKHKKFLVQGRPSRQNTSYYMMDMESLDGVTLDVPLTYYRTVSISDRIMILDDVCFFGLIPRVSEEPKFTLLKKTVPESNQLELMIPRLMRRKRIIVTRMEPLFTHAEMFFSVHVPYLRYMPAINQ